jgi:uncharacterized membrane protein YeaQ/YmgE (transglycosylase-associated protein family)
MVEILVWVVFGALAGWIASLIMKTDAQQGAVMNVLVGIAGAFVGGYLARMLGGSGVTGFNFGSLLVAILGAVVVLFVYRLVTRKNV